jgi:hypothetical protein
MIVMSLNEAKQQERAKTRQQVACVTRDFAQAAEREIVNGTPLGRKLENALLYRDKVELSGHGFSASTLEISLDGNRNALCMDSRENAADSREAYVFVFNTAATADMERAEIYARAALNSRTLRETATLLPASARTDALRAEIQTILPAF